MVLAMVTNMHIVQQIPMKEHVFALMAFCPQIVGNLISLNQRLNFGSNKMGQPIHVKNSIFSKKKTGPGKRPVALI
jgi:hypothetical protein